MHLRRLLALVCWALLWVGTQVSAAVTVSGPDTAEPGQQITLRFSDDSLNDFIGGDLLVVFDPLTLTLLDANSLLGADFSAMAGPPIDHGGGLVDVWVSLIFSCCGNGVSGAADLLDVNFLVNADAQPGPQQVLFTVADPESYDFTEATKSLRIVLGTPVPLPATNALLVLTLMLLALVSARRRRLLG